MEDYRNNLIAFICGFAPSSFKGWIMMGWLGNDMVKIFLTIILGFAGGFAGILGKDIYRYTKRKIFSLFKKQ